MLRTFASMYRLGAVLCCSLLILAGCSSDDDPPNNPPPSGNVDEKVRPVLFVHGENESAEVWNIMAGWFLNNGHAENQVYAVDISRYKDSGNPDAAIMAAQIKAQMDAIVTATGEGRVDIVAHGFGARGVQHYLTQLGGTERAAHVVWIGGLLDANLKLDGSMTPAPCEYMTVVSDGNDATQNGNATAGTITGVTNLTAPGADHQQLCINSAAFSAIYKFFTGTTPLHTDLPTSNIGSPHKIYGRVLSYIDNEPIAGATVNFIPLKWSGDIYGPYAPVLAGPVVTDAQGRFVIDELVNDPAIYVRIDRLDTARYNASRVYRQPYLKGTIMFDRYYVLPRTGGSLPLQNFYGALKYSPDHSNVIVNTVHRAIYNGRDVVRAHFLVRSIAPDVPDSLTFGNASVFPPAGSGGQVSNVTSLVLFDANTNKQNDSGPIDILAFKSYTFSSYDLYFWSTNKGYTSGVEINGKRLYFQNWRSADRDIVWLKFDNLE